MERISVEKKLPNSSVRLRGGLFTSEDVLVLRKDNTMAVAHLEHSLRDTFWYIEESASLNRVRPNYWMPLPAPPPKR